MKTRLSPLLFAALCLGGTTLLACSSGDDDDDAIADDDLDTDASDSDDTATDDTATSGDETGGEEVDPFEGCTRDVVEDDFAVVDAMGVPGPPRWSGPGADPETGELLDDGTSTYVVSATYLAMQPTPEAQETFNSLLPALNEAMFTNPGLVAVQLGGSQSCGTARTFSVWTDEEAMMEFVTSDPHVAAIGQIGAISRSGSAVTSWTATAADINWDAAVAQLAEVSADY